MRYAFSLVELSIVLVILGLLTGGILGGQSLIRAAELRAATTEYQRYSTAIQTFRDKYFAVPGDFRDGTRFWGRQLTTADCPTNSSAAGPNANGTCDGDGNNIAVGAGAVSQSAEMFQFWRQLALAGLIEGTYTGISGASSTGHHILGENAPRSKLANAGWGLWNLGNNTGDAATYAYNYGPTLGFGSQTTNWPTGAILKPEEAWNIDTKVDDGLPGGGRLLARDVNGFGTATPCTTSTSQTDKPGAYRLSNSVISCALHFANVF